MQEVLEFTSYAAPSLPTPPNSKFGDESKATGECLPGARPAHARHTTFVLRILSLAPSLSSPWEVPQVDRTRPQTFYARDPV